MENFLSLALNPLHFFHHHFAQDSKPRGEDFRVSWALLPGRGEKLKRSSSGDPFNLGTYWGAKHLDLMLHPSKIVHEEKPVHKRNGIL